MPTGWIKVNTNNKDYNISLLTTIFDINPIK